MSTLETASTPEIVIGRYWRPIETAPKDETRVLLARVGVAAMHTAFWRGGVWHCGNLSYFNNPTHWMPLPPAPQSQTTLTAGDGT